MTHAAVVPRFLAKGEGKIVNLASVVALAPELTFGIYGGTKAYVLAFSQALQSELGSKGIYVQAVLPAATRTEIWERSGKDIDVLLPGKVMNVGDLVDAALVGFDKGEVVTIPPLAVLWAIVLASSGGETRTRNLPVNSRWLCRLSYPRSCSA